MTTRRWLMMMAVLAAVLVIAIAGLVAWQNRPVDAAATLVAPAPDISGFARATGPAPFAFPLDHGPHPDYQTEWWYYTGNVTSDDGRHFGYQLTFFRRAIVPADARNARVSDWAADQIYMAHFALTDVEDGEFYHHERFARGAAGLAGAISPPYSVWLENWRVEQIGDDVYQMRAATDDVAIDFILRDTKGPVLQGDQGYSQKGPDPGNASYYYSLTRLQTEGTVRVGDEHFAVSGLSWKDHEYSTSALSEGQVGWDWFAIQLDDGTELKVFHIRRADGSIDPFSSGSFVAADGSKTTLTRDDFEIEVHDTWRSPHSRADYPSRWTVRVPSLGIVLDIEPYIADQELGVSYFYYEGAVRVSGQRDGRAVNGSGYVEMTGYAASMEGQF